MSANPHTDARGYPWVQRLLRTACRVFFRRVEVVGLENLPDPETGAVIFCGNHSNSLLDPILITAYCTRVVHFAAKDVLFRNRLLRFFLRLMGAVPVKRRDEHGEGADNRGMFSAMYDAMAHGCAVGIFPEGISHQRAELAPLKTGAARMAFGAAKDLPSHKVYLIPTGLSYFRRNRFRSSVLIQFGRPIEVDEARADLHDDDEARAVRELTDTIDMRLRALTINADDWSTLWVLDGVRRMYQPEKVSLEERARVARRFAIAYPEVADKPDVSELFVRVETHLQRQAAAGLDDRALQGGVGVRNATMRFVGHVALLLIALPLFLVGAPIHVPVGLFIKVVGNYFSPRKDVVATTKFVLGLLILLLVYGGLTALAAWQLGWKSALLTAFLLPASGYAMVVVISRVDALRHILLTGYRIFSLEREIDALREERNELREAVRELVEKYRHVADMAELAAGDGEPA